MGSNTMDVFKLTCIFSIILPIGVYGTNPCPIHWVQATFVDMGCLLFNSTATYTWEAATEYCYTFENSSLVELQTAEQLEYLNMEMNVLGDHEGYHYWWTGGTDLGREGKWTWMGSWTAITDVAWRTSYPNGGIKKNCM